MIKKFSCKMHKHGQIFSIKTVLWEKIFQNWQSISAGNYSPLTILMISLIPASSGISWLVAFYVNMLINNVIFRNATIPPIV
jgi:ABC-type multidrug transport system permease subunit